MAGPREREAAAPTVPAAGPAGGGAALPDGGRRTVVVAPEDVWQAPGASAGVQDEAAPEIAVRAGRRAFFAPIVMVVGLSAALMAVAITALALLLWLGPRPVG